MPKPSRSILAVLFGASASLALGVGPVAAAPPPTCTDLGYAVYCTNLREEVKEVTTPSGVTTLQANLIYDASYTFDNGFVLTDSGTRHVQYVVKDNTSVAFHDFYYQTSHGNGYTCTFDYNYVYIGGVYRYFSEAGGCVED